MSEHPQTNFVLKLDWGREKYYKTIRTKIKHGLNYIINHLVDKYNNLVNKEFKHTIENDYDYILIISTIVAMIDNKS